LVNHGITGVDNTGSLNDSFEAEITAMVNQLESNGATIIGIACNTAHVYLNNIIVNPETTIINLIDSVATVDQKMPNNYLLMTSMASKQQKLYHGYLDKHGVSYQETTANQQKLLDKAISLVMAHDLKASGRLLDDVLVSAKKAGFSAVIAGCTELPIAIANCTHRYGLTIIDSNEILAQTLVNKYYKDINY
jgi:aspartate racemase